MLEVIEVLHVETVISILNHKIPIVFHNLKNFDSHFIMQGLGKFNLKINVIRNGLEKYMSFTINDKLSFINSFQFLSSSLDSLVENLNKDNFNYLSQEFDNNILDLVTIELRKNYLAKKRFIVRQQIEKLVVKNTNMSLMFGKKFGIKMTKDCHDLYLK